MTEDEYWASQPEDDDDEILGEFLSDENSDDDLTLVMLPKLEFDVDETVERYAKLLKKCRSINDMKLILYRYFGEIKGTVLLMSDIERLQDDAKEMEMQVKLLLSEYGY